MWISSLLKPLLIFSTLYGMTDGLQIPEKCLESQLTDTKFYRSGTYVFSRRITRKRSLPFNEKWFLMRHIAFMKCLREEFEKNLRTIKILKMKKKLQE